jgi:large subunit ribosomal protein L31
MKTAIHPKYYEAQVTCSCGNSFTVGSTSERITVELCYNCHPFYTGQQKFVDTASRIEKFQKKMEQVRPVVKKAQKETSDEDNAPKTLREMLEALKKG